MDVLHRNSFCSSLFRTGFEEDACSVIRVGNKVRMTPNNNSQGLVGPWQKTKLTVHFGLNKWQFIMPLSIDHQGL